jgi:hypothetical protein
MTSSGNSLAPAAPVQGLTIARVKGIPLELGGVTRIVPPLSLGALEQLQDGLANFTGDIREPQQITTLIAAAHSALRRNYPDVTREDVADWIDLENALQVMEAVMDVSGLKRKAKEAALAQGEATAG